MAHPQRPANGYDRTNGQAFRQWIIQGSSNRHEDEWYRQQNALPIYKRSGKGVTGPCGLVEMAIKVVAGNFSHLEMGHLDNLPSHLIYRIWEYLDKTQEPLSFQSWKLCTKYILNDDPAARTWPLKLFKHAFEIAQPMEPLAQYINPLLSTSFEFIVHLTLTGRTSFGTHELLSLSQLRNLGVLEIMQPEDDTNAATFPRITDSVIREWASQTNPFPVLRIMRIWGDDFTTEKSLRYMSKFPALVLYDVAGRRNDWKDVDQTLGWERQRKAWSTSLLRTIRRHLDFLGAGEIYDEWGGENQNSFVQTLVDTARSRNLAVTKSMRFDQQVEPCMAAEASQHLTNETYVTCFDLWGFILYSHLGRAIVNNDLLAQGLCMPHQAFEVHGLALPPRPFASLGLGTSSRFRINEQSRDTYSLHCGFEIQSTFVRSNYRLNTPGDQPVPEQHLNPNTKRHRASQTTTTKRLKKQKCGNELFAEIVHGS
ncbi:hypothetical protein F4775DRAFT_561563 [Biscogniauxia sp. FL1348]|nr:hypothetical protein F4775DRAFT_561563 [Biscogniauxia sp. FL1348]